jgi:hypothetical protein
MRLLPKGDVAGANTSETHSIRTGFPVKRFGEIDPFGKPRSLRDGVDFSYDCVTGQGLPDPTSVGRD